MTSSMVWRSHLATLCLLLLPACGDSSSDDGGDDAMATESGTGTGGTTGSSSPTTDDPETSADTTSPTTADTTNDDDGSDTGSSSADSGTDTGAETDSADTASDTTGANCDAGDGPNFTVTNQGLSDYLIDGVADPDLTLVRGCTYTFDIDAQGHPFAIKTQQVPGPANTYDEGVTNNGTASGTLTFQVPLDAPDTLFYICQVHAAMTGTLDIIDG